MAFVKFPNLISLQYPTRTEKKAEIALGCNPFQISLFVTMGFQSVGLKSIISDMGLKNSYTSFPLSELAAENYLLWLIQVGVLRPEVDGQGITDSFSLTPLGHQLVKKYTGKENWPQASISDRPHNFINPSLRLPV
jgi:hypothetical protein